MVEANINYTAGAVGVAKSNTDVNKYVGNKKVIDSGTLIAYNSEDIIITINSVHIRFVILEDSKITDTGNIKINPDPNMDNAMIVSLYNMHNIFPEGAPNPFHIANVGGKKIFISFFVTTVSKELGARIFHYTLMEGE